MRGARIGLILLTLLLLGLPSPALAKTEKRPRPNIRDLNATCKDGVLTYDFAIRNLGDIGGDVELRGKIEYGARQKKTTTTYLEGPPFGTFFLAKSQIIPFKGTARVPPGMAFVDFKLRVHEPGLPRVIAKSSEDVPCS